MRYLFIFISLNSFAITLIDQKKDVVKSKKISNNSMLKQQIEYYKNKANTYKKLSEVNQNSFDLYDDFKKFRSGDMIKGHLFNYVLSTNLNTPIIVIPDTDRLPEGSKILCEGRVFQKRVAAQCSKVITPTNTIEINAVLLSRDGSFGLVGKYEDGRNYEMTKIIAQGALNNILESQRDTINTDLGLRPDRSNKNILLDGVLGGVSKANYDIKEGSLSSVYLRSRLKIILYFK